MSYATLAELETYTGAPANPDDERLLERASEVMDDLLVASVYAVDTNGNPVLATHIDALRDAVCAQVEWWRETGDELGTTSRYSNLHLGPASIQLRGSRNTRISPRAITALHRAALLPGKVSV